MNLYQHTKNKFISFILPWHTASFRVLRTEWPHSFLTKPTPIFFNQLLFSMNLYQHAKNQAFSSFCFRDKLTGWVHFGPYCKSHIFPKNLSLTKFVSAWKKPSSFHLFNLGIQQILELQDLKGHAHFWPTQCKNY